MFRIKEQASPFIQSSSKEEIRQIVEFDILTSVWIMASNDQNPFMLYETVRRRLDLPDNYPLEKIIAKRSELFRKKVPEYRIDSLKKDWIKKCDLDEKKIPSFLQKFQTKEERINYLNSISEKDIFRSQFRIENDADRSDIEIIDWGLKHIERLRNNLIEEREKKKRNYKEIWIPIGSLILTMIILISNIYLQRKNQEIQITLKKYEISFKPRQEYYASILGTMIIAYTNAHNGMRENLTSNLDNIERTFYYIEPFLSKSQRDSFYHKIQGFSVMCYNLENLQSKNFQEQHENYSDSLIAYRTYFREKLYPILFNDDLENPQ